MPKLPDLGTLAVLQRVARACAKVHRTLGGQC
jgi:hypothetical protein